MQILILLYSNALQFQDINIKLEIKLPQVYRPEVPARTCGCASPMGSPGPVGPLGPVGQADGDAVAVREAMVTMGAGPGEKLGPGDKGDTAGGGGPGDTGDVTGAGDTGDPLAGENEGRPAMDSKWLEDFGRVLDPNLPVCST